MEYSLIHLLHKNIKTSLELKKFCEVFCKDMPNINFPTMGGIWFWNNIYTVEGWRVQQHTITKHYRVLDDEDIRRAWGLSAEDMISNLKKFKLGFRE